MRRDPHEQVAAAARRRLDQLSLELARSGYPARPREHGPETATGPSPHALPPAPPVHGVGPQARPDVARTLAEPGRHARRRGARVPGWVADRLPLGVRGRVALGPVHAVVVAALVVLGLGASGFVWLRSGADATPVPAAAKVAASSVPPASPPAVSTGTPSGAGSATPSGRPGAPSASGASAAAAGTGQVVVDVAGKVRRPGIATLPAGSRVADAIRVAGGARRGVDLSALNLARVLADGEQILVGVRAAASVPVPGGTSGGSDGGDGKGAAPGGQLVNLNTADQEQLESLPGVGPVTAQKILQWRASHQTFSSVDELLEVDGIGEKTLAKLAPYLTL